MRTIYLCLFLALCGFLPVCAAPAIPDEGTLAVANDWAALPLDDGTRQVIEDGLLVLYDQEGLLKKLI